MEEYQMNSDRAPNPRRKKRTKMQIFKETYLPVIIAGLALILIIVFIIGSITRAVQKNKLEKQAELDAAAALAEELAKFDREADDLLAQAADLAADFDYQSAIDTIKRFSGKMEEYPALSDALAVYESAFSKTVAWNDFSQIPNLSFQLLVADPPRAFSHGTYGNSFNRNFVTVDEFARILQGLYDNGYILVDMEDVVTTEVGADGLPVYKPKTLYLPQGKKPIMLTQTNVNYNYYMIDSDGDKLPDADGGGFASKLLWDGTEFTCEMVDSSGATVYGSFDLVPILENFVETHPDFSYKDARATLALTGYNGLFGYRTEADAVDIFGTEATLQATEEVKTLIAALREKGYKFACYTYDNIPYGESSVTEIQADMNDWNTEVTPILGKIDTLAYAQLSDITSEETYSDEKYSALHSLGFRYYLGFCEDGEPWGTITAQYVRQGRIIVSGANIYYHDDWFTDLFDTSSILDTRRGDIPD